MLISVWFILHVYCGLSATYTRVRVCVCSDPTTTTPASSGLGFSSTLDAINAVSSAVDVLAFIQSQCSSSSERVSSRSVSLREMMRRATTASRTISGVDMRDTTAGGSSEREDVAAGSGVAIPTLSWPPDPPTVDSCRPGRDRFLFHLLPVLSGVQNRELLTPCNCFLFFLNLGF